MLDCVSASVLRHAVWRSGASSYYSSGSDLPSRPKRYPQIRVDFYQGDGHGCRCAHCKDIHTWEKHTLWNLRHVVKHPHSKRVEDIARQRDAYTHFGMTMGWREIPRIVQACIDARHSRKVTSSGVRLYNVWCDLCRIRWIVGGTIHLVRLDWNVAGEQQNEA